MMNLTLKQLRYLDALAAQGHFGRAASICAVSQPALSMQIKELEDSLGLALVERGGRQVRLTEFGARFVAKAREVLAQVEDMGEMARAAQDQLMGRLRLGVIPTIAPYLLPQIMTALGHSHAGLDLHVRETQTHRLLADVEAGLLEAAIVALPVSEPGLTEVALFDEPFVLVRPGSEAGRPVPDARAMAEMRLLLLEEGHCFRDQALEFCGISGVGREALDASSLSTLVQMVDAGIGVTLLPEMAVRLETRSTQVDVTAFPGAQPPTRTVGMVWRRSSPLAAQLNDIAQVVRAAALS